VIWIAVVKLKQVIGKLGEKLLHKGI
jgi:hypothetical protein